MMAGMIGMVLLWVLIVSLLFLGITSLQKKDQQNSGEHNPAEALKLRLAKGEITEADYDRLLKKIK
ncbi:MAG: hypothetical protein ACE3JP_04600 [Ectobacillus sp.]